jgi:hypothetical protein
MVSPHRAKWSEPMMHDKAASVVGERQAGAAPEMVLPEPILATETLEEALGQTLREALDLDQWDDHAGLQVMLDRIPAAIKKSVVSERKLHHHIQAEILLKAEGTLRCSGCCGCLLR